MAHRPRIGGLPAALGGRKRAQSSSDVFISAGGGSGAETDPLAVHKSVVDAVGDLIVASGADAVSRLAKGTDGQVLTVDSAETLDLKWATPAGGTVDHGVVTALPGSPTDGDVCTYTDFLTSPTYAWQLRRFDSDWWVIGGSPIQRQDNDARTSASTSFVDVPTDPMSFDLPLAGDYDIEIQSMMFSSSGTGGCVHSYALEGTAASDDWGAQQFGTWQNSDNCTTRHTGLAATTTIAEKMRATVGGTASVDMRRLRAMPVRLD